MERKLATIRKISAIQSIKNADFIEIVKIDGWQCIVRKGEFKVNDLCVYFEIDSFIPIENRYEFLRKSSYRKMYDGSEGFKLKTIRLKKQLSQGLAMPLSKFPELKDNNLNDNVTEVLNVKKWEMLLPIQLRGQARRYIPSFINKTSQERIQNLSEYFEIYTNIGFEESEKLDGASCSVYYFNGDFGVCSNNIELKEDNNRNIYWKIINKLNLINILKDLKRNIALQGEIIGDGIVGVKKNSLKFDKGVQKFYLFNIWDIDKFQYLTPDKRMELFEIIKDKYDINIEHVPIIRKKVKIFSEYNDMDSLLEYAKGYAYITSNVIREGLIYKSCNIIYNEIISFKVINNDYLLK